MYKTSLSHHPCTWASTQGITPILMLKVLGRTQHRRRQWGRTLLMPAPRNPPCPARELLPPTGDPCPIRYSAQVTAVRAGASRIVGSCRLAASPVVISSGFGFVSKIGYGPEPKWPDYTCTRTHAHQKTPKLHNITVAFLCCGIVQIACEKTMHVFLQ